MEFSIILIFYDCVEVTEKCVDSILKSSLDNFEIILVDNGSSLDNGNYLAKKYKKDRKVKYCRLEVNQKVTGGFNLGAKKAIGKFLIFMNNDIEVANNWLFELHKKLKKTEKIILQPRIMSFNNKKVCDFLGGKYVFPGYGIGIGHNQEYMIKYKVEKEVDYACSICFLIAKTIFYRLDGFDDSFKYYYEDVDLCLRAKKLGVKCFYIPKSVVYHKGSVTLKDKREDEAKKYYVRRNQRKVIEKNFIGLEKKIRLGVWKLMQFIYLVF